MYVCRMTKVKTSRSCSWSKSRHDFLSFYDYAGRSTTGWPANRPQPRKGYTKRTSAPVVIRESSPGTEGNCTKRSLLYSLGHSHTALGNTRTAAVTFAQHVMGSGTVRLLRPSYVWFDMRPLRHDELHFMQWAMKISCILYSHQLIKQNLAVTAVQHNRNRTCHYISLLTYIISPSYCHFSTFLLPKISPGRAVLCTQLAER